MKKLIASLQLQKQFPLKSQGYSMLPILRSDDVVYFKKTCLKNLKISDLVLVKKNHQLFTHRVIYKAGKYLVTKGDNNLESDGKIYPRQIIGKVYQVKRNGQIFNPESLYLLQSTQYFQEIVKIKTVFEKEKINFVFLKGLPLHLYFEKTHPKRVYADCDVLVDKKDFFKAEKILLKNGYKKVNTSFSLTQKKLKDKEVENAYFKVINGFAVVFDFHLEVVFMMTQLGRLEALYPQKLIDQLSDEFLKTKKIVKINGESFFILNSKFLILYLALHFFHHNFRGAFRYQFLDMVIRIGLDSRLRGNDRNSEWEMIAQKIAEYRLGNFVYPVFVLLKKYYQTPLPDFMNFMYGSVVTDPYFINLNIFNDEPRFTAGINRFKLIFILSPQPLWRKLFIFFNPTVVWSILWVIWKKLSSFFSNRRVSQ